MVLVFMLEKLTYSLKNSLFNHCHILRCLLKCNSIRERSSSIRLIALQLREMSSEMLALQMVEYGTHFRKALTGCVLLFYSNFSTTCRNLFSDFSPAKSHCKNIYDMPNKLSQLGCH